MLSELLDRKIGIRENTNVTGDPHRFSRDFLRGELCMFGKRPGCRQRVWPSRTDGADSVVRFDHVAIAGNQECAFRVRDDQERLEVPQRAILAPFLGQFDGGLRQIPLMFLKLSLEALEKGKGVRRGPGKPGENLVIEQAARLSRGVLHHVLAHGDLAVSRDHDFIVPANAQNRGAVNLR